MDIASASLALPIVPPSLILISSINVTIPFVSINIEFGAELEPMYFPSPTINPVPSISEEYDGYEFDATSKINLPSKEPLLTSSVCANIAANLLLLKSVPPASSSAKKVMLPIKAPSAALAVPVLA